MRTERKHNLIVSSARLEAFSDGVLAVIITLMVLELHPPHSADVGELRHLLPSFLIYALSFRVIAAYWNNHHHLFMGGQHITPKIMWLNMHLLFWLSLIPFFTAWLGEHYDKAAPTASYAALLFVTAVAYQMLQRLVIRTNALPRAKNVIGVISLLSYACAIPLAYVNPYIADTIFVLVALLWFMPGRALKTI